MKINLVQNDIEALILEFRNKNQPNDRYTSFDYCYNYFKSSSRDELQNDLEKSCLTLGFYLASWGMLRGSSFLLQKSAKYYLETVIYISELPKEIWEIDVDNYSNNYETIIEIYNKLKSLLIESNNASLTLTTKIVLGVFGFLPAFDLYFSDAFRAIFQGSSGFRVVNKNTLQLIEEFYQQNKTSIDGASKKIKTIDFISGIETSISYPKAKIIDMYGFTKGLDMAKKVSPETKSTF